MSYGPRPGLVDDLCHFVLDEISGFYSDSDIELPEHRYVSPGPAAWDCEQVTVELLNSVGITGDLKNPTVQSNPRSAGHAQRAVNLVVQVVRCIPTWQLDASAIMGALAATAEADEKVARLVNSDAQMIESALIRSAQEHRLPSPDVFAFLDFGVQASGDLVGTQAMVRFSLAMLPSVIPDLSS